MQGTSTKIVLIIIPRRIGCITTQFFIKYIKNKCLKDFENPEISGYALTCFQ